MTYGIFLKQPVQIMAIPAYLSSDCITFLANQAPLVGPGGMRHEGVNNQSHPPRLAEKAVTVAHLASPLVRRRRQIPSSGLDFPVQPAQSTHPSLCPFSLSSSGAILAKEQP